MIFVQVGPQVGELVRDVRKLMGPYTASNLREKSYNRMKDFAAVAGQLGVTHLMVFSQTDNNVVMRVSRFPSGPTLHFKIEKYSLARQVRASQKRPFESPAAYMTPPLVVLNNFSQSEESQVKLMKATFQHMYPTINVKTVRLSECRRVVLFNYNKENGTVEMRHYAIRATPVGISKSVKKIIQSKIPDLGKLQVCFNSWVLCILNLNLCRILVSLLMDLPLVWVPCLTLKPKTRTLGYDISFLLTLIN